VDHGRGTRFSPRLAVEARSQRRVEVGPDELAVLGGRDRHLELAPAVPLLHAAVDPAQHVPVEEVVAVAGGALDRGGPRRLDVRVEGGRRRTRLVDEPDRHRSGEEGAAREEAAAGIDVQCGLPIP
jgi:hypothetical protein